MTTKAIDVICVDVDGTLAIKKMPLVFETCSLEIDIMKCAICGRQGRGSRGPEIPDAYLHSGVRFILQYGYHSDTCTLGYNTRSEFLSSSCACGYRSEEGEKHIGPFYLVKSEGKSKVKFDVHNNNYEHALEQCTYADCQEEDLKIIDEYITQYIKSIHSTSSYCVLL